MTKTARELVARRKPKMIGLTSYATTDKHPPPFGLLNDLSYPTVSMIRKVQRQLLQHAMILLPRPEEDLVKLRDRSDEFADSGVVLWCWYGSGLKILKEAYSTLTSGISKSHPDYGDIWIIPSIFTPPTGFFIGIAFSPAYR